MEYLPEDCFAHILSFTSPLDVCRTSLISSVVKSMADSDTVWAKFLPHNYQQIVSRLVGPSFPCSTEKELFFRLCKPQPIDDGNKVIFSYLHLSFYFQYLWYKSVKTYIQTRQIA